MFKKRLVITIALFAAFILFTLLVANVDVRPMGVEGTNIGFAGINTAFHELTGENMILYDITDPLMLVSLLTCVVFFVLGLFQLITRRSIKKVDKDIIALGVYFVIVIGLYLMFEKVVINYRPILIEGVKEASYPSSTTLLVVSVMPVSIYQARRRLMNKGVKEIITWVSLAFTAFMVIARLISGVHWLTDIIGGAILGFALVEMYFTACAAIDRK